MKCRTVSAVSEKCRADLRYKSCKIVKCDRSYHGTKLRFGHTGMCLSHKTCGNDASVQGISYYTFDSGVFGTGSNMKCLLELL